MLNRCTTCKKLQGKSYSVPREGNLPEFRVHSVSAFHHVGIDYFGPLYVRCYLDKTKEMKVWLLLVTCAVTRAVHFKIVSDMTTEKFILAFQRFAGRRGIPSYVRSDNAKTFKSASEKIRLILESEQAKEYFGKYRIEWQFNLEKTPW